jgi:hypothetical protein
MSSSRGNTGSNGITFDLNMLKHINWDKMASDVHRKILIFGTAVDDLDLTDEAHRKIASDLVLPILTHLAMFCESVEFQEVTGDESRN